MMCACYTYIYILFSSYQIYGLRYLRMISNNSYHMAMQCNLQKDDEIYKVKFEFMTVIHHVLS